MENELDYIVDMTEDMPTEDVINLLIEYNLIDFNGLAKEVISNANEYTVNQIYSFLRDEY